MELSYTTMGGPVAVPVTFLQIIYMNQDVQLDVSKTVKRLIRLIVCLLVGFLTSSSTTRLYRGRDTTEKSEKGIEKKEARRVIDR